MGCESRQVGVHEQLVLGISRMGDDGVDGVGRDQLEVWPESYWAGFALRQADVFQSYAV